MNNYLLLYGVAALAVFAFLQGAFILTDTVGDVAKRAKRRNCPTARAWDGG